MSLMSLWFSRTNFLLRLPASSYQLLNIGRCKLRTSEVATPTLSSWLWGLLDTVLCCCCMWGPSQTNVKSAWRIINHLYWEGKEGILAYQAYFSSLWKVKGEEKDFWPPSFLFIRLSSPFPSVFHRNIFAKPKATGTSVTSLQTEQVKASYVSLIGRSYGFLSSHPHNWKETSLISYKLLTFVSKSCKLLLLGVHWAVHFSVPSSHWRMFGTYLWHHAYTSFVRQTW